MAAIPFPAPLPTSLVDLPAQPDGVPFPSAGPDGWPVGPPVAADTTRLEAEIDRAFAPPNEVGSEGLGESLALVVVQGGRIVAERYHPDGGTDPLISWSMAKSITQALIGVANHSGRTIDLGPVAEAYPGVAEGWQADGRSAITGTQLLQMRSGLAWTEEYEAGDSGAEGDEPALPDVLEMLFGTGADDHARFAAGQPLEHPPGEHFYYSSGTSNILAAILAEALAGSNASAAEREAAVRKLIADDLAGPLGMTSADPRFDTAGTFVGSSYFYATARDFARFGLLYLRDGVWDGRRLLPEGWVDAARTPQALEPDSLNWYGQHWWVYPCSHGTFRASGYEGQAVAVVPGLDLVIVRLGKTPFANGNDPLFLHLAELISCFE